MQLLEDRKPDVIAAHSDQLSAKLGSTRIDGCGFVARRLICLADARVIDCDGNVACLNKLQDYLVACGVVVGWLENSDRWSQSEIDEAFPRH